MSSSIHKKVTALSKLYEENGEKITGQKALQLLKEIKINMQDLSNQDKIKLKAMGVKLRPSKRRENVHNKVNLLIEFYKEYGRVPKGKEVYKGIKIGIFYNQIKAHGKTRITDKDRKRLDYLGISLEPGDVQKLVHEKVLLLVKFYEIHGRVPKSKEYIGGYDLGSFFYRITRGKVFLSEEDKLLLEEYGINYKLRYQQQASHKKVVELVDFFNENGRLPKQKEKYGNDNIGLFLFHVKEGNTKLTQDDISYIKRYIPDFEERIKKYTIYEKIDVLIEFFDEHGRRPKYNESFKGIKIGSFCSNLRYRELKISDEYRNKLVKRNLL